MKHCLTFRERSATKTHAVPPSSLVLERSVIGCAVAIGLACAGADVVVNYVTKPDDATRVVREIERLGRNALAIQADVSNEADVEAMLAQTIEAFGTLHIVFCNAGLQRDAPFDQMTIEQWNTVIGVNLTGQFFCARSAVREFRRRGLQDVSTALGKIICMSSVHRQIPWAGHANYAASKGGIAMLMQTIAQELGPHRTRVNSIAPGAIRTPINTPAWSTPQAYDRLMTLVPYGASASRATSRRRLSGWPLTPPITSRAPRSSSTAACRSIPDSRTRADRPEARVPI